jgi:hypothetical protein
MNNKEKGLYLRLLNNVKKGYNEFWISTNASDDYLAKVDQLLTKNEYKIVSVQNYLPHCTIDGTIYWNYRKE